MSLVFIIGLMRWKIYSRMIFRPDKQFGQMQVPASSILKFRRPFKKSVPKSDKSPSFSEVASLSLAFLVIICPPITLLAKMIQDSAIVSCSHNISGSKCLSFPNIPLFRVRLFHVSGKYMKELAAISTLQCYEIFSKVIGSDQKFVYTNSHGEDGWLSFEPWSKDANSNSSNAVGDLSPVIEYNACTGDHGQQ